MVPKHFHSLFMCLFVMGLIARSELVQVLKV